MFVEAYHTIADVRGPEHGVCYQELKGIAPLIFPLLFLLQRLLTLLNLDTSELCSLGIKTGEKLYVPVG